MSTPPLKSRSISVYCPKCNQNISLNSKIYWFPKVERKEFYIQNRGKGLSHIREKEKPRILCSQCGHKFFFRQILILPKDGYYHPPDISNADKTEIEKLFGSVIPYIPATLYFFAIFLLPALIAWFSVESIAHKCDLRMDYRLCQWIEDRMFRGAMVASYITGMVTVAITVFLNHIWKKKQ